jgi:hypothetical protein
MKIYQVVNKATGAKQLDYRTKTVYLRKHAAIARCKKYHIVVEYDLTDVVPKVVHGE